MQLHVLLPCASAAVDATTANPYTHFSLLLLLQGWTGRSCRGSCAGRPSSQRPHGRAQRWFGRRHVAAWKAAAPCAQWWHGWAWHARGSSWQPACTAQDRVCVQGEVAPRAAGFSRVGWGDMGCAAVGNLPALHKTESAFKVRLRPLCVRMLMHDRAHACLACAGEQWQPACAAQDRVCFQGADDVLICAYASEWLDPRLELLPV
jgi:hypothetical protein